MKMLILLPSLFFTVLLLMFTGCNDNETGSPYAEALLQPPYSALTDSIKNDRTNADLYFRRAVLLKKNNLPEPALADFQKAWSLKDKEEYAANISALLVENKPDSAVRFIRGALQKIPGSIFLQLDLARAYNALNKKDEALQVCREISKQAPGQIDALLMTSDLLEEKQDSAGSLAALETAYAFAPFDQELNYSLAYKYAESRNPKALILCDSLLKKDSLKPHAEPYYFKGIYYSNIAQNEKAIDCFNQAIQHDFNFHNAYIEKGKVYYYQKKIREAEKVFTLLSTISPSFADAYYWIAKCQQFNGQLPAARENYLRAYGLDKTLTEAKDSADKVANF